MNPLGYVMRYPGLVYISGENNENKDQIQRAPDVLKKQPNTFFGALEKTRKSKGL